MGRKAKNNFTALLNLPTTRYTHRIGIVEERSEGYSVKRQLTSSSEAFKYIMESGMYDDSSMLYEESFFVIGMNKGNHTIGHALIGIGTTTSTIVGMSKVLQFLMLTNASTATLVHNHPSGRLFPSQSDIDMTRKLKEIMKMVDIYLVDHVIIGKHPESDRVNYYSFADSDMLNNL